MRVEEKFSFQNRKAKYGKKVPFPQDRLSIDPYGYKEGLLPAEES
jgi:hypothetical protein